MCEAIAQRAPDLPFLICSGFASATLWLDKSSPARRRVLAKPFSERTFLQHVRGLLDEAARKE